MAPDNPKESTRTPFSCPFSWVTSLPPEIWKLIGEQIRSQKTLRTLVGLCRTFQAIFTPLLFAQCKLPLNKWATSQLGRKELPTGLKHTKELEVQLPEFATYNHSYNVSMNEDYALFAVRMLEQMQNLRSFRWLDSTFENDYSPSLMLRNPKLLSALKSCESLKSLCIQFTGQLWEDDDQMNILSIPLAGFRNLTSLELYSFYGDEAKLTKDIAGALWENPGLKTLGLGILCNLDCDGYPEVLILEPESNFLEKLCIRYGSRRHAPQLHLETLRLGHGLCLIEPKSPATRDYISRLTTPASLRTLHLYNGFTKFSHDDEHECIRIDWSLLQGCTSLIQLSVSRLEDDIRDWLNSSGRSVQELVVTDHYAWSDQSLKNFDMLLPQLSMLFTRELTVSEDNDYFSDTESSDSWTDTDSSDIVVDMTTEDSTDIDSESHERKTPNLAVMTVLDRLKDGGSHLTRLCLCLDLETQWNNFASRLSDLQILTQLRVTSRSHRTGQYPTKASSLWPETHKPKDLAYRYAQLMCEKCPSLQYIRIQDWAWQGNINRGRLSESEGPGDGGLNELRELAKDEMLSIDLFAIESFAEQCGLSGRESAQSIEEMSEEEQKYSEKVRKRIHDAVRLGILTDEGSIPEWWMAGLTEEGEGVGLGVVGS